MRNVLEAVTMRGWIKRGGSLCGGGLLVGRANCDRGEVDPMRFS